MNVEASSGHAGGVSHATPCLLVVSLCRAPFGHISVSGKSSTGTSFVFLLFTDSSRYCDIANLEPIYSSLLSGGSGDWTVSRITTEDNGYGPACSMVRIQHGALGPSYGGP